MNKLFKIFILALVIVGLLGTKLAAAGVYLRCSSVQSSTTENGSDFFMNDYSAVVAGTLFGDCTDLKGRSYSMVLDGLAPGIFWGQSYFTLACPTVSKARLNRVRHIKFGAFRATAAAGIGATAGFMINPTGGACVLAGFEIGVGATLNIGYMGLHTGSVDHNHLRSMWWDKKTKKRKHARKRNGLH